MCDQCARLLQPRPRLRRALDVGDLVSDLRVPVVCSLDYRGPVRQILNAYKDDGQRSLTPWLAPALLASINHALITCVSTHQAPTFVPVPTRKSSQRRRGFDHVESLSTAVTRSGSQCRTRRVLRDTRGDPGSKYLSAEDRSTHVREAFSVRGTLPALGTPVILIDDIVTTGATAREATATLVLAGMNVVAVATIAGTP
jgi:ComF family protein